MIMAGRVITLLFWVLVGAALLGFFQPEQGAWIIRLGALILLAHAGEVMLMQTLWKDRVKPVAADIPMVLVFGAFWLIPRLKASQQ